VDVSEENQQALSPVTESSRIDVMDILRGFALIGIVFMNIEWFNRSGTDLRSFDVSLTGMDHAIGWLVRAFVEGKFYKLFALLFGMGFAVMLLRAREAGRPFGAWFIRRMLALLLIGLAHQVLLWDGDILHDYAFAGLVFLGWIYLFDVRWLRRFNTPSAFLKIGIVWLILPFAFVSFAGIKFGTQSSDNDVRQQWQYDVELEASIQQRLDDPTPNDAGLATDDPAEEGDDQELTAEERRERKVDYWVDAERARVQAAQAEIEIMSGDSYLAAVRYRVANLPKDWRKTPFFTFILLIPIYLIGYWFVASGVLQRHREHQQLFNSIMTLGLALGTVLSVAGLLMIQHPIWNISDSMSAIAFWTFNLGQLVLAAGYFGLIVVLAGQPMFCRVLKSLAPFGRMALTNYIMQTVILVLIFHGYAGGQFGEVSRSAQMLIVVAIIVFQMLLSAWWLKRFRFGPLEWIWRSATYLSWQRLRLQSESAAQV
jgi:uncharacterized protein